MIEARFIIESQGRPKSFVENSLKKHIETFKNMKGVEVHNEKWEKTEEINGLFSALVDIGIKAEDTEKYFAALIGLAPTAVVLENPEKMEVTIRELQNMSNDIVQMFHAFAQANSELRMRLKLSSKEKKEEGGCGGCSHEH